MAHPRERRSGNYQHQWRGFKSPIERGTKFTINREVLRKSAKASISDPSVRAIGRGVPGTKKANVLVTPSAISFAILLFILIKYKMQVVKHASCRLLIKKTMTTRTKTTNKSLDLAKSQMAQSTFSITVVGPTVFRLSSRTQRDLRN